MMISPSLIQLIGAVLFGVALLHTFSTQYFEHLAHTHPKHAGIWHLLGEVEVVFGLWATVLMFCMFLILGQQSALEYINSRNFTEPMFVFVIMVMAGARPILQLTDAAVRVMARCLPLAPGVGLYFLTLALVPLVGSVITEPAAMTLAALLLRSTLFSRNIPSPLKYATVGVLFVNISIGGTLTPFAAPPVLMVAGKWNWDTTFMLATFGWKAALAVVINAGMVTLLFRRHLTNPGYRHDEPAPLSFTVAVVHVAFLALAVMFAHHPPMFMGVFLLFLGFVTAYREHHDRLILREALLVAFFLAGLVVLGGVQQWWLEPLLMGLDTQAVFFGATALTAITDNAALTYLGSMVEGLSDEFKVALVAGAVTGGGLTVIANAPNPAGVAILRSKFSEGSIHPLGLLLAALPPTATTALIFQFAG
jgi:hypothetical protein